jgi:hypothetical protein
LNLARESQHGWTYFDNLEFYFPNQGFESVTTIYAWYWNKVAPMVESGNARR